MTDPFEAARSFLDACSASRVGHINGDLLSHLEGTRRLLAEWEADEDLQLAGLCHAAYGTDGFPPSLIDVSDRGPLREAIGERAEADVYFYASCDREFVYPLFGREEPIRFRDRFADVVFNPDVESVKRFVELTFANELELAREGPAFREKHRDFFIDFFRRSGPRATTAANTCFRETFGI